MIVIEHNIPMPMSKYSNVATMQIGDSFIVKTSSERVSVRTWLKKNNPELKMITRKVDAGFRIWRIE
tara:strand:- start:60 stop:260 length:201 start_codon:yes stop_codon:yes gene_type:complete